MKRTFLGIIFFLLGLGLMVGGMFVPSNYRGIDARLINAAGRGTPSVVEEGLDFVRGGRIGSARQFLRVADELEIPGRESLELSLEKLSDQGLIAWGRQSAELNLLFEHQFSRRSVYPRPFLQWLIPREARVAVLRHLEASHRFGVKQVLASRSLTNLVHFSPVASSAGHPLDAVTLLGGLLLQGNHMGQALKEAFETLALRAVKDGEVQELELAYLDLLALGNRLDWGQLTDLLERCESLDHLRQFAHFSRSRVEQFPLIYAAVMLSQSTGPVLNYLVDYGTTGMPDLAYSLKAGRGAVVNLLRSGEQVNYRPLRDRIADLSPLSRVMGPVLRAAESSWLAAVTLKYGLILAGGMSLIGMGWMVAPVMGVRAPRRLFSTNQLLFLSGALLLLFVMSEPFLFDRAQTLEFPLRWKLPMLGEVLTSSVINEVKTMDSLTYIALILFLVLQAVIYIICLVKLAEIRRQPLSSQLKLKLLDNEENMFDAGLYVGLGGTVGSLVLLAMQIVDASLMAAYASTLFGIIFVAILKIFHLRPLRRSLILDGEQQ